MLPIAIGFDFDRETLFINLPSPTTSISKNKNQNKTNRIFTPSHIKKGMNLNLTVILDVKAKKQNCDAKETAFEWKIDLQSCYNSNSTTVMANMNLISVITLPASNPPNYIFHLIIYSKTFTTIQIIWKNSPLAASFSALYFSLLSNFTTYHFFDNSSTSNRILLPCCISFGMFKRRKCKESLHEESMETI